MSSYQYQQHLLLLIRIVLLLLANSSTIVVVLSLPVHASTTAAAAAGAGGHSISKSGRWQVLQPSIGVSAMHAQLLSNDRVIIYDRTDFGPSNISLPTGHHCVVGDCTAHSVEYDVVSNKFRPLTLLSDTWCSSGSVAPDGHLIQTGGNNLGDRVVRLFNPCHGETAAETMTCDWEELGNKLLTWRWYATDHILPNGQVIIVGGRDQYNYEFYPKTESTDTIRPLPFLEETKDGPVENNLYPFVFLNVDGNLFIFANHRAILLDYKRNVIVRRYPPIPGADPRSFPSTGSAVLLPLRNLDSKTIQAEVLICGGAPRGSFEQALNGKFIQALNTCARINITSDEQNPQWVTETMPIPRCMGDMLILPNGHILIINGVSSGTASWDLGRDAVLTPILYNPLKPIGTRFRNLTPTTTPRVYHSTAILLRDGRVMVGGSNPHNGYEFGTNVIYPTQLSLEALEPPYLDMGLKDLRPRIVAPTQHTRVGYGQRVKIVFSVDGRIVDRGRVKVTMIPPPFNTHSFSHGQRLLVLSRIGQVVPAAGKPNSNGGNYQVVVKMPGSGNLAPAGYYMLFVVHRSVPSEGIWLHIQ